MNARAPRVSVVIPAFNAASSIDAALRSVFAQTYRDIEVIVADDGSTDGTADRLAAWRDHITVLRQPNAGPASARNAGILASHGDLVAFLDADDEWLPHKLERQVTFFGRYPETGLLHTAALKGAPRLRVAARPAPEAQPPRRAFCDLFHTTLDINTLTVVVPRAVLDRVGLFDERREVHVEDWDLWLRIAAHHPIGYLPEVTAIRRPGGIMSSAVEKTFEGQAEVIRKTASLCASSCSAHAGRASACLARRWHRLEWERGYARLEAGNRTAARAAFIAALRHRPLHLGTYLQLAATFTGERSRSAIQRLRAMIRRQPAGRVRPVPVAAPSDDRTAPGWAGRTLPETPIGRQAVSLLHDTAYRRVRRIVAERVHDLDDLLTGRGEPRRVLFQAASPMSFIIFRPVYEKLRTDPRIEFWFTAVGSTWRPEELYSRVGIHERVVPARRVTWMKVDACVNADFWDTAWLRRRTRRVHLFHGVAGKYGLDAPLDLAPVVATYDRLLFPNRDRLGRYVDAGLVAAGSPRGVLAGYPKVDRLVDGSLNVSRLKRELELDASRTTVVYAPTWSPHSSLNLYGEAILDRLSDAGFNVLVKLHDRSYDLNPRGSGGVDWAARLSRYQGHPRVRVVSDPDSTPFLAASDVMVTDHSSVGFEFALLDRPIVVMECPQLIATARITASKVVELRSAAEVVNSVDGLVPAVMRQLEAPTLHSAERQALASRYFYQPGTATNRAAAAIYEVLGLAVPEPSVEPAQRAVLASAGR